MKQSFMQLLLLLICHFVNYHPLKIHQRLAPVERATSPAKSPNVLQKERAWHKFSQPQRDQTRLRSHRFTHLLSIDLRLRPQKRSVLFSPGQPDPHYSLLQIISTLMARQPFAPYRCDWTPRISTSSFQRTLTLRRNPFLNEGDAILIGDHRKIT